MTRDFLDIDLSVDTLDLKYFDIENIDGKASHARPEKGESNAGCSREPLRLHTA